MSKCFSYISLSSALILRSSDQLGSKSKRRNQFVADYFDIETIREDSSAESRTLYNYYAKLHVNSEMDWICRECDVTFPTKKEVVNHMSETHLGVKSFKCKLCPFSCKSRPTAYLHARSHQSPIRAKQFRKKLLNFKPIEYIENKNSLLSNHFTIALVKRGDSDLKSLKFYRKTDNIDVEDDGTYKCRVCEKIFHSDLLLRQHIGSTHIDVLQYECKSCLACYNSKFSAYAHFYKYRSTCNSTNNKNTTEKVNQRVEENNDNAQNEGFGKNSQDLLEHLQVLQHKSEFRVLDYFKVTYVTQGDGSKEARRYFSKLKAQRTNFQSEWKCCSCESTFSTKRELNNHLVDVHIGRRRYVCKFCHETFDSYYSAAWHGKKHKNRGIDVKPQRRRGNKTPGRHGPDYLEERHRTRALLEAEELCKSYICSVDSCKQEYTSEISYQRHMKTHNIIIKKQNPMLTNPFMCEICGSTLIGFRNYWEHKRRVHFRVKNYPCTYENCEWTFYSPRELRKHKIRHHGEPGHKCPNCRRTFQTAHYLKYHLSINKCEHLKALDVKRKQEQEDVVAGKTKKARIYKNTKRRYQCILCSHQLSKKPKVISHLKKMHCLTDKEIEPYLDQINNLPNLNIKGKPKRTTKTSKGLEKQDLKNDNVTESNTTDDGGRNHTVILDNSDFSALANVDSMHFFSK